MDLSLLLPYSDELSAADRLELVQVADRLGYRAAWMPEAWSNDAFVVLAGLATRTTTIALGTGIVNIFSRSPTQLAQSAAALDELSAGRAILGIGASGREVVEGWHGVPFERPLGRTREVVEIVRAVLRREPVEFEGRVFSIPGGLKLINRPVRDRVPIFVAAMGQKNVALTAEIADGWFPTFYSPAHAHTVYSEALAVGSSARTIDLGPLQIVPSVPVAIGAEVPHARRFLRQGLGFYLGAMGSNQENFYAQLYRHYGYEEETDRVQQLYREGRRKDAILAVSDEMVNETAALGDRERVRDRLVEYADAGATMLAIKPVASSQLERVHLLETLATLV